MNKAEYWLLDAAIRLKIPLQWLSAGNVDEILNRPHHHLSMPELLVVLERMFERGDLFLESTDRAGQSHRTQAPSRSEIEAALSRSPGTWKDSSERVVYGVTDRGGALWEELSNPQWEHFLDEQYGIDPYEAEMSASTRGLIEERLALIPHDTLIKAIVPESIRWSVLQPWQATYWKQLPVGYHVEFNYLPPSEEESSARPARHRQAHPPNQPVRKWYTSYLDPDP